MKAVVVGAGRIGCGFAGQLLRASGYELVFVGRNAELVDHLNRVGRYEVHLTDTRGTEQVTEQVTVDGIRAVSAYEPEQVAEALIEADVVATAVGCNNLLAVSALISEGLGRRTTPVNVFAFENLGVAGSCLAGFVTACQGGGSSVEHGFGGVLVSRVVAQRLGDPAGNEPLVFLGDRPGTFIVDGKGLKPPVLPIQGMTVTDNYEAWAQRKLFVFSAGHATVAYLGYLKGYHYIHTAVRDPEIREAVLAAMREGREGLLARYGPEIAGDESELLEILRRFENAALNDSIERVGRDPLRKLSAEDRLVGPARLAQQAGVRPEKLMLAAAAAMFFCGRADPSAERMQEAIGVAGPGAAIDKISGFHADTTLGRSVVRAYCRLADGRPEDSRLLSLDRFFWA